MENSDAQLVAAACQGDLASFGQLYKRHYRLAVGIARSRLGDVHLAEDAAQEAFAVACRTLHTLKNGNQFAQWLGTICRRLASRMAQRRSRDEPLSASPEPAADTGQMAARPYVQEALERLDEASREIVVLHYFSGLTHEEIGGVMGLSAQAIHGRLQRARHKLAQLLAPSGIR